MATEKNQRKDKLVELVSQYKEFKAQGKLDLSSEETIRTWLNQFLAIFDWDVRDTSQVLQEKVLSKAEKEKLKLIGSQNTRPDYTLKIAKQKLTFLDAKDITVSIKNDKSAAFQIKSYGYSIIAPCAFISNFEEFAIYDCTYVPDATQEAFLGRRYFTIDEYVDNFEILEEHLLKENIYKGKLNELYSVSFLGNSSVSKVPLDLKFAQLLSEFRLSLAQNIFKNNTTYIDTNTENLSYITQIIINRVLFIRVCEARKIEEEGLLLQYKKEGFWASFKDSSYFNFYDHYDGPLFDRIDSIHKIKIDDSVFDRLLTNLYYPSPYRFDVIPTKLLSDIYEIFLSKRLIIENSIVRDEIKMEYSKTNGAVSTPQFIVQDIIKRTITKSEILKKGIEDLLALKILDIACGSGVFIIETFEYIEEILREIYEKTEDTRFSKYFVKTDTELIVNLLGKKAIIDNCLFGIDIDAEAVEVAKMSLSLKIVDATDYIDSYNEIGIFGNKILNGVGENIKCGNSLVETDIIKKYPDLLNNSSELIRTNPFDWNDKSGFGDVFTNKGGFDYIVGNPPYVEVKNYNVELPNMHAYVKTKFLSSANHKIDLAIPFIEQSLKVLNNHGRVGFIVQKRFFKTDYGKKIREIISSNKSVASIIDFENTDIFKDRITYVSILILGKSPQNSFYYKLFKGDVISLPSELRTIELPEINSSEYNILKSSALTANPWNFGDADLLQIRDKLQSLGSLGEYLKVRVGIQVLWDKAYHIRVESIANGRIKGKNHVDTNIEIELDACRPLMCNENFYPYRPQETEVYVIFPYDVNNGKVSEITFSSFKTKYPLTAKYLEKHKTTIQKSVETFNDVERWHLYTRVQNHGATYHKIMIPMTALDPFASVSLSDKYYCDNANVFFLDVPQKDEHTLYAVSAIINSTLFSVLARSIANPQQSGYFKFNKQFLEPVPFPLVEFTSNIDVVERLSKTSISIEQLQKIYKTASPAQKKVYEISLRNKWEELDNDVYNLYKLSDIEREFFNNRGRNIDRVKILN